MKHDIIEKPKLFGCLTCATVPRVCLPKDWPTDVGFGSVTLIFDGRWIDIDPDVTLTVEMLEQVYGEQIRLAECALLKFDTPLHDETYEFNKEDGEWYLVGQGRGFA